jgi:predicted porin
MKYSDVEDTGLGLNTLINGASTGVSWRRLIRGGGDQPGEGRRHNLVRYDTPELAGFMGTANWGEDDAWEIGLRYKGEFGDFKLAAAIAYGENSDANTSNPAFQCVGNDTPGSDTDCEQLGGSVSVMHAPTGIYVNFAAGYMQDNLIGQDGGAAGIAAVAEDRSDFYAGEVGIEQKWNSLGKTTVFGQYYRNNGGSQDRSFNGGDIVSSELESFGVGVVQGIDAAAMHMYLTYRHYQGEVTSGAGLVQTDVDDLDVVMGGAIIRF